MAVFAQAREENDLPAWSDMLAFLDRGVTDPTMAGIIADPRVERGRLASLMLDVGEGVLSNTGKNFVRVLIENHRLALVPEIRQLYEVERADYEGSSRVEVRSAFELDDQYQKVIRDAVAKRTGRDVDFDITVDDTLIGGVVIKVGDTVIDASLRGRLDQLALQLG
jgi:F-type H+-transporting ATPase subunit delta